MKKRVISFCTLFLIGATLLLSTAHAYTAKAELESLSVTISGPGVQYLNGFDPGVRRKGDAPGNVPDVDDVNYYIEGATLPFTDNEIQSTANYYLGSVSATQALNSFTFNTGRVTAFVTGDPSQKASAWLSYNVNFNVIGTPVKDSNISVQINPGNTTIIENDPLHADASLYVTVSDFTYIGNDITLRHLESTILSSSADTLDGLNGFTFDLADYAGANKYSVALGISADASIVPIPSSIFLFSAGLVGLAGFRRKGKRCSK